MKYFQIKIKEPWWGAWKKFNWPSQTWGIGLKKTDVESAIKDGLLLKISIWKFKRSYFIDPAKVKEYIKLHQTAYTAKFDTLLWIIPETIFDEKIDF